VKAHSGIKENEIADLEAKKGAREDNKVEVKQTQVKGATFNVLWRDIELESPLRKFIRSLNSSIYRAEWTFIKGEGDKKHESRRNNMCWESFRRIVDRFRKSQGNSLEKNSSWIFFIKCINRQLPTLEKRYQNRPDIYKDSICPRCKEGSETLEHLLECAASRENWRLLETKLRKELESLSKDKNLTLEQSKEISKILFPENSEAQKAQRQDFSRGIIRKNIRAEFMLLNISKGKTKTILAEFLEKWFHFFKELVWNTRCKEIIQWEKVIGITKKEKRKKRKNLARKINTKEKKKVRNKEEEWQCSKVIAFDEIESWIHQGYHQYWNMY
jgi:hypothetical protein